LKSFNLNSFHPFISRGINIAHSHFTWHKHITQLYSYTNILHGQLTLTHRRNIFFTTNFMFPLITCKIYVRKHFFLSIRKTIIIYILPRIFTLLLLFAIIFNCPILFSKMSIHFCKFIFLKVPIGLPFLNSLQQFSEPRLTLSRGC
jgi:hypothetical protein